MARFAQNVIQHDFGFPRAARSGDADFEARYTMLVSLGATKLMVDRLMQDLRSTGPRQAIVDFAGDGEGDIRRVIAQLHEQRPWRRERSGAT
jgi:hypothetical protein